MQVLISELAERYAGMREEEFLALRREDLVDEARPLYDLERARRGMAPFAVELEEGDHLLAEVDRRRRRAAIRMALVAGPLAAVALYFGVAPGGLFAYLAILYFMGPTRGDKLVVWLRRFHLKHPKALRFDQLLAQACMGLAFPVTVQDSTFKRSSDMALSQIFLWQPLIALTALIPMALAGYGAYLALQAAEADEGVTWWVVGVSAFVPLVITWICFYRRLSCLTLKPATARAKTEKVIDRIQRQKGMHMSGTFVVKCGDSFWREIVELFLKAHSAAVIDVTEVSENVLWEIGTSLRVLGPESIVLAYGVAADGEKKFSDELRAQLAERFGGELDGVQTFLYPLSRKQLKRDGWGSRNELTLELRKKLAVGITYAKQKVEVQEAFGDVAA